MAISEISGISDLEHPVKGCVCYIHASLYLSVEESNCETRKMFFILPQKLFFYWENQILIKIKF